MKKILTAVLIVSALFSCKKDKDDSNSNTKSKTTLLTQATWRQVKVERRSTMADAWEINNFSNDPCNADNITTFTTSGIYNLDDASVKCNPLNPQTVEGGTYTFASNETHMNVIITNSGINMQEDWSVEQLDESTFVYNYYFPNGGPYYRVSLGH